MNSLREHDGFADVLVPSTWVRYTGKTTRMLSIQQSSSLTCLIEPVPEQLGAGIRIVSGTDGPSRGPPPTTTTTRTAGVETPQQVPHRTLLTPTQMGQRKRPRRTARSSRLTRDPRDGRVGFRELCIDQRGDEIEADCELRVCADANVDFISNR